MRWGFAFLLLWAGSLMAGLLYYAQNQIVPFDPDQHLLQASMSPDFDARFADTLVQAGVAPGSVVHLQNGTRCYCNELTEPHQVSLGKKLADDEYHTITLDVSHNQAILSVLSTFPALAILDHKGELRYLGPYATGYGCFSGKTLEASIVSVTRTEPYLGAQINADNKGCFCPLG